MAEESEPGWAIAVEAEPQLWIRGPGTYDGEWLELDVKKAKDYGRFEEPDLLFDLAAISRPADAVAFIEKHGLLRAGPSAPAAAFRERFSEWEGVANTLRATMQLYKIVQAASAGDKDAVEDLRVNWSRHWRRDYGVPTSDSELVIQAAAQVAASVNTGLRDVRTRIVSAGLIDDGDPSQYVFMAAAPSLVGFAYHLFALTCVTRQPLAACADCRRFFILTDKRQTYCTPTCSSRARYRRWKSSPQKKGDTQ